MNNEIIKYTYEVIDFIQQEPLFVSLLALNRKLESDEMSPLMNRYKKTKESYLEAKKYSRYHPDLKTFQLDFQQAKTELYSHPIMNAYLKTYRTFQNELDDIVAKIAGVISPKIKFSTQPSIK